MHLLFEPMQESLENLSLVHSFHAKVQLLILFGVVESGPQVVHFYAGRLVKDAHQVSYDHFDDSLHELTQSLYRILMVHLLNRPLALIIAPTFT